MHLLQSGVDISVIAPVAGSLEPRHNANVPSGGSRHVPNSRS
nr:hypothetical protein [Sinorhizobium meliloti]